MDKHPVLLNTTGQDITIFRLVSVQSVAGGAPGWSGPSRMNNNEATTVLEIAEEYMNRPDSDIERLRPLVDRLHWRSLWLYSWNPVNHIQNSTCDYLVYQ